MELTAINANDIFTKCLRSKREKALVYGIAVEIIELLALRELWLIFPREMP